MASVPADMGMLTEMIPQDILLAALQGMKTPKMCIAPGTYSIRGRVTLDLELELRKGEPYYSRPTTGLPITKMLALAFDAAGIKKDEIRKIIITAVEEATKDDGKLADYVKVADAALKEAEGLLQELPPTQPCKGKTSVKGGCQVVSWCESNS